MPWLKVRASKKGKLTVHYIPFATSVGADKCGSEVRTELGALGVNVDFEALPDVSVIGPETIIREVRQFLLD